MGNGCTWRCSTRRWRGQASRGRDAIRLRTNPRRARTFVVRTLGVPQPPESFIRSLMIRLWQRLFQNVDDEIGVRVDQHKIPIDKPVLQFGR